MSEWWGAKVSDLASPEICDLSAARNFPRVEFGRRKDFQNQIAMSRPRESRSTVAGIRCAVPR